MSAVTDNVRSEPQTHPCPTGPHEGTGVSWRASAGDDAMLIGSAVPDWCALGRDPRAVLVKRNPLREVYRVTLARGVFFAKVFIQQGFVNTLKRWALGDPALREYAVAEALAARGIGAIRAVTAGVSRARDRSVLVSEEFPGARTLTEAWEASVHPARALSRCVAALLARTHAADVLPRDTHADNLLVRAGATPEDWEVVYVDLAGMRVGRAVSDAEAARNIAELYQWFRSRATAAAFWRFLRAYTEIRFGTERGRRRRFGHLVEAAAVVHERRLWAKRDRRILGTNAFFAQVNVAHGWKAHVVLRPRPHALAVARPDEAMTPAQWQEWLQRHLGADADLPATAALPDGLVPQGARAAGWRALWWGLAGSPLRRAFVRAHALRHRDLPAVYAPAVLERRPSLLSAEAVLLLRAPAGGTPMRAALEELLTPSAAIRRCDACAPQPLHALIEATARLLADLVRCGVTAPALTLDAFALAPGSTGSAPAIMVTEVRGLRVHRRAGRGAVAWLPACLLRSCLRRLSRVHQARFVRTYWHRLPPHLRPGDWQTLWRRIGALSRDEPER